MSGRVENWCSVKTEISLGYPSFLKGKYFFGHKRFKNYKNCNQIVKESGGSLLGFSQFKSDGIYNYVRLKFDKPFDDQMGGKVQLIEKGPFPIFNVEYDVYFKEDGQCKVKTKYRYSFQDETITRIGCTKRNCTKIGIKKDCSPLKNFSCRGYPIKQ